MQSTAKTVEPNSNGISTTADSALQGSQPTPETSTALSSLPTHHSEHKNINTQGENPPISASNRGLEETMFQQ
jgi:hypothetical protein